MKNKKKPKSKGWIGVDFDGTLAIELGGKYNPSRTGPPVPKMLYRVRKWLAQGKDVRIFTARVNHKSKLANSKAKVALEKWCMRWLGRKLPITASKDMYLIRVWDDKAVGVRRNTGQPIIEIMAQVSARAILRQQP